MSHPSQNLLMTGENEMAQQRRSAKYLISFRSRVTRGFTYFVRETEDNEWYWVLVCNENGETIADSEQCYANKRDCIYGLRIVRNSVSCPVIEQPFEEDDDEIDDV